MSLTKQEIATVINLYIGVKDGYLGNFSYHSYEEFYLEFCDLDISPSAYDGTTKTKFVKILESSDQLIQSKILYGVLKRFPISYFPVSQQEQKARVAHEVETIIRRLENGQNIIHEKLIITNATVERAIQDTRILIEKNGAISGVDRIHTTLHGYLKQVCKQAGIAIAIDETLTQLFKKLRNNHPSFLQGKTRQTDIDQIINSFSNVLDKLNLIRNNASISHPNEELLEEDEALFVVNAAQIILNYLNRKFKN